MLVFDESERLSLRHIFNEDYFTNSDNSYWIET